MRVNYQRRRKFFYKSMAGTPKLRLTCLKRDYDLFKTYYDYDCLKERHSRLVNKTFKFGKIYLTYSSKRDFYLKKKLNDKNFITTYFFCNKNDIK